MAQTAAERKRKQRQGSLKWLRDNHGVTPDALITAMKKGWAVVTWIKRPEKKKRNDLLSKKK